MNIANNLYDMTFKEIANEFNEIAKTTETYSTTEPRYIKSEILKTIKKSYRHLDIRSVDTAYNKFQFEIKYQNGFQGLKEYDRGRITLVFSIRTKRTDKLEEVSKTRKKYVHTKHDNPVTFSTYDISSYVSSFNWATDYLDELRLNGTNWSHSNGKIEKLPTQKTIQELLDIIPTTYEEEFRLSVVQPYVQVILAKMFKKEKFEVIYDSAPSYVKEAIDKNENVFDVIADYIIQEKLHLA